jgi:hypothetical protein
MQDTPPYLQPYLTAASRYGSEFGSLLWASPTTQESRFDAMTRVCNLAGKSLLDVGCGRADLLDYLLRRAIQVDHYTGLEAVAELADAAARKKHPRCLIIPCDFITQPGRLFTGADVIYFSGSLNTLEPRAFYQTLRLAYEAAVESVVFNFLSSPHLAAADYLNWYPTESVLQFADELGGQVTALEDYLAGDCTIHLSKAVDH